MKIGILGTAHTFHQAPFNDTSWELWACNLGQPPRWDRWFQLHNDEVIDGNAGHRDWLAAQDKPVYLQKPRADIPNALVYPLPAMTAKYGTWFFTSTIALMMALALEDGGLTEIGLWGVDMADCLCPHTQVLTADLRWVRLGDVEVGDKLIGFDEMAGGPGKEHRYRNWRVATVEQADELMKPCYRVDMADGTSMVASDNHLWLTSSDGQKKWRKTKDLVGVGKGGAPSRIFKPFEPWREDRSWEAGYLAAAFDGEGHLSQKPRGGGSSMVMGFSQRLNAMNDQVMAAAGKMGISMVGGGKPKDNGTCYGYTVGGGRVKVMEALGKLRPPRLLERFDPEKLGAIHSCNSVAVVRIDYLGMRPVIGIKTSTKTFIAEGFCSHNSTEYGAQKNGVRFFLQLARMRGIKVTLPPESEVLVPGKIYGYDEPSWLEMKAKARLGELVARNAGHEAHKNALVLQKASLMGARDITLPPEQITAALAQVDAQLGQAERDTLLLAGAIENMKHIAANWTGTHNG